MSPTHTALAHRLIERLATVQTPKGLLAVEEVVFRAFRIASHAAHIEKSDLPASLAKLQELREEPIAPVRRKRAS